MPERRMGEPLSQLISRFVKSKREQPSVPDLKQRLAVAYTQSRKPKRESA